MKRLLMIAAALLLAHQAQAADLSVAVDETEDHPAAILIKGQIGDRQEIDLFSALIGYQKKSRCRLPRQPRRESHDRHSYRPAHPKAWVLDRGRRRHSVLLGLRTHMDGREATFHGNPSTHRLPCCQGIA